METLINGRYQLHEPLGQGGMGVVYRATDRLTGEIVALKQVVVSSSSLLFATQTISDLQRDLRLALAHEFQTLASLRHPHIISVLDYGFGGKSLPYFTMTYLEGAETIFEASQRLATAEKVRLIQEMLEALAYLHRRGILHRDIKPGNVLVVEGQVRVLDFGLAAAKEQATESVGSWLYMPPEVLQEQPATEASDLYSAGVLAYRVLSGEHPFDIYAEDVIDAILYEPPDMTRLVGVDASITAVVAKLLAKEPADRYQTAVSAIAALSAASGNPLPPETRSIRESYLQAATFVGREAEMMQLVDALGEAKQGKGSVWLVGGESGVGKSRLLDEFRIQALVDGWRVLRGQGVAEGGTPYQLWREIVPQLALTSELTDLEAGVLQTIAPDISLLLGRSVPEPPALAGQAAQERLFLTLADVVRRQTEPILLLLEDLQWAEESLAPLQRLQRQIGESRLLILGSYRDDERPKLPEQLPDASVLSLSRLNEAAIGMLSEAMLGTVVTERPEVVGLLQQETEGNAFFLVEVVRALAEEAGRLTAVREMTLPKAVLTGGMAQIVRRRLDKVPAIYQPLLKRAAVAGREIDLRLMAGFDYEEVLAAWLRVCHETAVLEVQQNQWRFAHDKLRSALLADLTHTELPALHREVAQTIETTYPNDPVQASRLVNHWYMAGDSQQERRYAFRAGQYATSQYVNAEAVTFLSRALDLTEEGDLNGRYEILLLREQIIALLGDREQQRQDLSELAQLAAAAHQETSQPTVVALRQANYAEAIGDYPAAIAAAQDAIRLAQTRQDRENEIAGYLAWGRALTRQAQYSEAEEKLNRVLKHPALSDLVHAESLRFLGICSVETNQFDKARRYYNEALKVVRLLQDKYAESELANNLAVVAHQQGDTATALTYWEVARQIHEETGHREGMARVLLNLGVTYIDCGQYQIAQTYLEQGLQIFQEIEMQLGVCYILVNLCYLHSIWETPTLALQYGTQALESVKEVDNRYLEAITHINLGEAYRILGQFAAAIKAFNQLFSIWREQENLGQIMEAQAGLARVFLDQGDREKAAAYIEEVLTLMERGETVTQNIVYLTCYETLQANQDGRAHSILASAYQLLQERSAQITDIKLRKSYLENIAAHRQIIVAYDNDKQAD